MFHVVFSSSSREGTRYKIQMSCRCLARGLIAMSVIGSPMVETATGFRTVPIYTRTVSPNAGWFPISCAINGFRAFAALETVAGISTGIPSTMPWHSRSKLNRAYDEIWRLSYMTLQTGVPFVRSIARRLVVCFEPRSSTIRKWHFGTSWTTYYEYQSFAHSDLARSVGSRQSSTWCTSRSISDRPRSWHLSSHGRRLGFRRDPDTLGPTDDLLRRLGLLSPLPDPRHLRQERQHRRHDLSSMAPVWKRNLMVPLLPDLVHPAPLPAQAMWGTAVEETPTSAPIVRGQSPTQRWLDSPHTTPMMVEVDDNNPESTTTTTHHRVPDDDDLWNAVETEVQESRRARQEPFDPWAEVEVVNQNIHESARRVPPPDYHGPGQSHAQAAPDHAQPRPGRQPFR